METGRPPVQEGGDGGDGVDSHQDRLCQARCFQRTGLFQKRDVRSPIQSDRFFFDTSKSAKSSTGNSSVS